MYSHPNKRYAPFKDPVSAKDLNYLLEKIDKLGKLDGIPPISVVNNSGNLQIGLAHIIPGVVRFELQENLDYYGFASAKTIYYNKDSEQYEVSTQTNINEIRVRDVQGVFAGIGPSGNRSGDRGYSLSLGVGKGYEVISLQTNAKYIHFRVDTAFTSSDGSTDVEIVNYYGGRHPLHDDVSSSGVGGITIYNPPARHGLHIFSGEEDQYGLGIWDEIARRYWIWNMEC